MIKRQTIANRRLQHRVVLGAERDHDGRVLRALALVDGRRVGEHQLIEFPVAGRRLEGRITRS